MQPLGRDIPQAALAVQEAMVGRVLVDVCQTLES